MSFVVSARKWLNAEGVFRWYRLAAIILLVCTVSGYAQTSATQAEKKQLGSKTAKGGFRNEDAIRDKFNNWQDDADAKNWLIEMGYELKDVTSVVAAKPHGDKADVVVNIKTKQGDYREGISIKLVSGKSGFNQIDKRWLSQYVKMWRMPDDVKVAMQLFLGETAPTKTSRRPERMYLNELEKDVQTSVLEFFKYRKDEIVSDLLIGDGANKADRFMVVSHGGDDVRWKIVKAEAAAKFFGEGDVVMTRSGNLRIGRISMQRKGGDGGRDTAKMLQFKLDPTDIFEMK